MFSSKDITDYFWNIQSGVSKLSFSVTPDLQEKAGYVLTWPTNNEAPSPLDDPSNYTKRASLLLSPIIKAFSSPGACLTDTSVYPLSQLTQLLTPDTSTELPAITAVLQTLASPAYENSSWTFTAGSFNPDQYQVVKWHCGYSFTLGEWLLWV